MVCSSGVGVAGASIANLISSFKQLINIVILYLSHSYCWREVESFLGTTRLIWQKILVTCVWLCY